MAENKEQSALSSKRRGRPPVVVEENSSYDVLGGRQCFYLFILFILLWLYLFKLHYVNILYWSVSSSTYGPVLACLNPLVRSACTSQTLFNPNKTVVKMFVVMYDLRAMPAGHQTFLRQRTFSVPVRRDANNQNNRKPLGHGRTLRYLIHLRLV